MTTSCNLIKFFVRLHGEYQSKRNFVEIPRKFTIAKLSVHKLGSSSVLMKTLLTF